MSKKRGKRSRRRDHVPKIRVKWVRTPIEVPRGWTLLVLIYARYSTSEQRRRSIKAQIEYCKKFLAALGIVRVKIQVIYDRKLSGELRSRPGIDRVWAGIKARRWHLILVEDCSRFYRDDVLCVELVRLAVDMGIRTICVNDMVDTAEPDWEERLKEAARHHASYNRYCSPRIKRAHEELWDIGAAIGLLKTGYLRESSGDKDDEDDEDAPKFDRVDPKWAPIIQEAYERIAGGEPPWSVALWLTEVGLPKASNCKSTDWTDRNVITLIQRTDYRGYQTYRDHFSKKEYSTGKHKPEQNEADEVLTRQLERLRVVEDSLWYAANDAIKARAPNTEIPRGRENPQYGVPRNSRTPVSGIFRCRCGAKMWVDGCGKPSYRCRKARRNKCWSKATALKDKTHAWLRDVMLRDLQSLGSRVDGLIDQATKILDDAGATELRRARLQEKRVKLKKACKRLGQAIAKSTKKSDTLLKTLEKFEDRLARTDALIESLKKKASRCAPPTRSEVDNRLGEIITAVERMDRTSRDEIKLLVGTIRAVPYQQFGSNKVVLRARFELRLAALLPARLRGVLAGVLDGPVHTHCECIPMLVDLFARSTGPKHGLEALRLKEEEGLGLTAIGRKLRITKRQANIAVQYGRSLRAAGLTDPYIELSEPPKAASRWGPRGPSKSQEDEKKP